MTCNKFLTILTFFTWFLFVTADIFFPEYSRILRAISGMFMGASLSYTWTYDNVTSKMDYYDQASVYWFNKYKDLQRESLYSIKKDEQ